MRLDGSELDADRVSLEEVGGERVGARRHHAEGLLGELLGGRVEAVEVVAAIMQEVAHLLVGLQHADRPILAVARKDIVDHVEPFTRPAECRVQVEKGAREPRRVGDHRLQVLPVGRQAAEDRVGHGLAQIADDFLGVLLRERRHVDREGLRQRQHDRRGQRTLVVLDLVEVARRNAEALGEGQLVELRGFTQMADLRAGKQLLAHTGVVTLQTEIAKLFAKPLN